MGPGTVNQVVACVPDVQSKAVVQSQHVSQAFLCMYNGKKKYNRVPEVYIQK